MYLTEADWSFFEATRTGDTAQLGQVMGSVSGFISFEDEAHFLVSYPWMIPNLNTTLAMLGYPGGPSYDWRSL